MKRFFDYRARRTSRGFAVLVRIGQERVIEIWWSRLKPAP